MCGLFPSQRLKKPLGTFQGFSNYHFFFESVLKTKHLYGSWQLNSALNMGWEKNSMTPVCKKLAGANGRERFRATEVVSKNSKMELYSQVSISTYLFFFFKNVRTCFSCWNSTFPKPKGQSDPSRYPSLVEFSDHKTGKDSIDFSGLKFVCSWFGVLSFWGNLGGWKVAYQLGKMYHAWSTGAPPERVYPPSETRI